MSEKQSNLSRSEFTTWRDNGHCDPVHAKEKGDRVILELVLQGLWEKEHWLVVDAAKTARVLGSIMRPGAANSLEWTPQKACSHDVIN